MLARRLVGSSARRLVGRCGNVTGNVIGIDLNAPVIALARVVSRRRQQVPPT
jgi:hypothetical protein